MKSANAELLTNFDKKQTKKLSEVENNVYFHFWGKIFKFIDYYSVESAEIAHCRFLFKSFFFLLLEAILLPCVCRVCVFSLCFAGFL